MLSLAEEEGFDILFTADSNIKYQQNISNRKIAIVVLKAPDNRFTTHSQLLNERIFKAPINFGPGDILEIVHPKLIKTKNSQESIKVDIVSKPIKKD